MRVNWRKAPEPRGLLSQQTPHPWRSAPITRLTEELRLMKAKTTEASPKCSREIWGCTNLRRRRHLRRSSSTVGSKSKREARSRNTRFCPSVCNDFIACSPLAGDLQIENERKKLRLASSGVAATKQNKHSAMHELACKTRVLRLAQTAPMGP